MSHDENRRRFFAYLNLFIAAMLLLVLGDSYLNLYVGWEGVGLASYLLIGFWNQKPAYATASKKAFVMNRVGDMGLSFAIMIAFASLGSVSFSGVEEASHTASQAALTGIGIMLLIAAAGKSAQFPLQAWLGDAMAGPTPVSALIHAATMVTAGVYLIVRSHFIFDAAPTAQLLVVIVGAVTLTFGALVGTAKDDIKKALAASTMSQIGYMILGAGLGPAGYAFAIMHLLTHGFFKAGMFLGAGSVMHGMNDQVDMRRYGALRKFMPITFATFGLGYLAIIGVPPFAGFYSKDAIIETAFNAGGIKGILLGSTALLGAAMLGTLGLIAGLWADKFDQMSSFQNFLITPMTFLSGVFYSIHSLPPFWQQVSHLNPFFYMIDGFRYGFFGVSDVSPWLSLSLVGGAFVLVAALALHLLRIGYKIRG
jgi:NADH-quinone oxidoreductase subunit L